MVLEGRISVDLEEVTKEIVKYLRKANISAQILPQPRMTAALILPGRYKDLFSFLNLRKIDLIKGKDTRLHPGNPAAIKGQCKGVHR